MATPSSLVSAIDSVLHALVEDEEAEEPILRIGLRNLKVRLIWVRNVGDDDKHAQMQSLFSRIQDVVARISPADDPNPDDFYTLFIRQNHNHFDDLRAVNCLAKEVGEECTNDLTLDGVVEVTDSLLDNILDSWKVVKVQHDQAHISNNVRGAVDEFEMQTRFLRDFLLFVKRAGAEIHQFQHLLNLLSPFLWGVACAFQGLVEGQSSFPQSLPVFQFCTLALRRMSPLDQTDVSVLKDFLSSLISLLWHLLRYQRHQPHHSVNLKALYECLRLSRSILKQQQQTGSGHFNAQFLVLMRGAGILICSLYLGDVHPQAPPHLLQRFDFFVKLHLPLEYNSSLKANALDSGDSTGLEDLFYEKIHIDTPSTSHESKSTPRDAVFQEDEVNSFLDRLLYGSNQLRLVPITGMAGLGKTTFALKIYNHPSIKQRFHARAWCAISQVFDKKQVLLQLLNQIQPGNYTKNTKDDLAIKLRRSLKGKRYLILLDDVWTPEVWESLRLSFDDDKIHSRVVLTSRLRDIVPHAQDNEQPYVLRQRNENECLEIIQMKLPYLVELRTELAKFAKLCKGLPLTSVLVSGLLSATIQKDWNVILNRLSLGGISIMEQCKFALELSYKHLPDELKHCFLYFGVFPEDEVICVRKLIHLWMAEGFVVRTKDSLEKRIEVAREYLDDLIQRNLVMVAKQRSMGGVKTCRVHDLLHDFCLMKGKQESRFHLLLERQDELSYFNEPCNLELRLAIHSSGLHFKESSLFCPLAQSMLLFSPDSGYLLFSPDSGYLPDILFIIQIYKNLIVFCADQMWCDTPIPSEIELLTRLTYLSISCHKPVIPSSIGNLSNLETLIIGLVETSEAVSLPHTIWNLQKLKYLRIMGYEPCSPGFILPHEDLENYSNLLKLESICGVEFSSGASMENQMRKFPNISSLKCNIVSDWENMNVVVPKFLSNLEFITLCTKPKLEYEYEYQYQLQFDFGCAENLKKLTLKGFRLSRGEIAVIGKLPNLEVLKLLETNFFEDTLEMEECEFSKLRILVYATYGWFCEELDLETWTAAGNDPLPCLEKLAFHGCTELKKIPCCLETSSTLEEIEVSDCSSALESLVRNIQEVQNDFGNLIKVQMSSEYESKSESKREEEEGEGEGDIEKPKKKSIRMVSKILQLM